MQLIFGGEDLPGYFGQFFAMISACPEKPGPRSLRNIVRSTLGNGVRPTS